MAINTRTKIRAEKSTELKSSLINWVRPIWQGNHHSLASSIVLSTIPMENFRMAVNQANVGINTVEFTKEYHLQLIKHLKSKFEFLLDLNSSFADQTDRNLFLDYSEFTCPSLASCSSEEVEEEGSLISKSRWMAKNICQKIHLELLVSREQGKLALESFTASEGYQKRLQKIRKRAAAGKAKAVSKVGRKAALKLKAAKELTDQEEIQNKLRYPTPPLHPSEEPPRRMGQSFTKKKRPAKLLSVKPSPSPSLEYEDHIYSSSPKPGESKWKKITRAIRRLSPEASSNPCDRDISSSTEGEVAASGSGSDLNVGSGRNRSSCSSEIVERNERKKRNRPPVLHSPESSSSRSVSPFEDLTSDELDSPSSASTVTSTSASKHTLCIPSPSNRLAQSDIIRIEAENQELKLSMKSQADEIEILRKRLIDSVTRQESTPLFSPLPSTLIESINSSKRIHSSSSVVPEMIFNKRQKQVQVDDRTISNGEISREVSYTVEGKGKEKEVSFELAMEAMKRLIDMDSD